MKGQTSSNTFNSVNSSLLEQVRHRFIYVVIQLGDFTVRVIIHLLTSTSKEVSMENLTPKQFLTKKIDYDYLDVCFYSDIEEGEYLVIEAIDYSIYDVIISPAKRRGWYDYFFLIYSESQKKLMKL